MAETAAEFKDNETREHTNRVARYSVIIAKQCEMSEEDMDAIFLIAPMHDVGKLEPPQRLPLWVAVFGRFFFWVWIAVGTILITGYWMIFDIFGGLAGLKAYYIQIMHGIGLVMSGIFAYIFFIPYQQLKVAVANKEYPTGGALMNKIRQLVTTNLVLGLITVIIASGGKYVNF